VRIYSGVWAGEPLVSPGKRVRATAEAVRHQWATVLEPHLQDARVLDLFAGSGALGLEALSRGAASCDFVEDGPAALHALKANVAARRLRRLPPGSRPTAQRKAIRVLKRDAIPFVQALEARAYDVAFADPPYGSRKLDRVLERWLEVPFSSILGLEHEPSHDLPGGGRTLRFADSVVTIYGLRSRRAKRRS
jgi:16S rRNA (guanine966-N2)-methyltransferase